MIRRWKLKEDDQVRRALENLQGLIPKNQSVISDKGEASSMNIFSKMKPQGKPQPSADNQLTFAALQAEIDTLTPILKKYESSVTQGLQELNDLRNHITALQVEQIKILSTVDPVTGANQ